MPGSRPGMGSERFSAESRPKRPLSEQYYSRGLGSCRRVTGLTMGSASGGRVKRHVNSYTPLAPPETRLPSALD
jgi:hypothetical protein